MTSGGRHRREDSAITHVRVSRQTKARLDQLKAERGYRTIDEVLASLLPQPRKKNSPENILIQSQPTTANTVEAFLRRPDVNKLISGTSSEIYRKYVAPM